MFVVMCCMDFGYDDSFDGEYSGIYHETRESAEAELVDAKLHSVDDETVRYCYIEER